MLGSIRITALLSIAVTGVFMASCASPQVSETVAEQSSPNPTFHRTIEVEGLDIFYREAGPEGAPTILLLHGYPTSSHMFRNLIRG